mmetsp:Transcript_33208/g.95324  ORF Transcript_33208/g.95324 Transcript_33208/m.95324 type:complete len:308 (+) Transcript_33208:398-1321(+)
MVEDNVLDAELMAHGLDGHVPGCKLGRHLDNLPLPLRERLHETAHRESRSSTGADPCLPLCAVQRHGRPDAVAATPRARRYGEPWRHGAPLCGAGRVRAREPPQGGEPYGVELPLQLLRPLRAEVELLLQGLGVLPLLRQAPPQALRLNARPQGAPTLLQDLGRCGLRSLVGGAMSSLTLCNDRECLGEAVFSRNQCLFQHLDRRRHRRRHRQFSALRGVALHTAAGTLRIPRCLRPWRRTMRMGCRRGRSRAATRRTGLRLLEHVVQGGMPGGPCGADRQQAAFRRMPAQLPTRHRQLTLQPAHER